MTHLISHIINKIGLDKSIAYSSGARVVQAVTGFITIFFISRFLTGAEQGYYFTFGSIVAIQVFFELGFTGIITQYVAHEFSHLKWADNGLVEQDERYKSRLASLMRFCVKWYTVISGMLLVALLIIGFVFFSSNQEGGDTTAWKIPWLILSVGTVIKLFQSPFNSFLMGLGKVKEMCKISFYQQLITPIVLWIGLSCGIKLSIVGISTILNALLWFIFVSRMDLIRVMVDLLKTSITESISYMKEIFPYQWRIAISWISGYFIFQLFNPVLFATEGAVVAGQMGMTLAVLNGIQAFSMSWINTKVPLYSNLIAKKEYATLDSIFNKTLKQQVVVCLGLLGIMFVGVEFLKITQFTLGDSVLSDRFLPTWPMILMMAPLVCNQFIFAWATYLRCHKKEPFLLLSVVNGVLCCLSAFILGHVWGLWGITSGYCVITVLFVPWAYTIFITCKKEWHG